MYQSDVRLSLIYYNIFNTLIRTATKMVAKNRQSTQADYFFTKLWERNDLRIKINKKHRCKSQKPVIFKPAEEKYEKIFFVRELESK